MEIGKLKDGKKINAYITILNPFIVIKICPYMNNY